MTLMQRKARQGADPGELVIEALRRRHLRQVLAIENQVYPRPWTPGVFASELTQARDGARYYVVAILDGRVVGYGGIMFTDDSAHVTNIAVDPQRHRRGIGRAVLVHLIGAALRADCDAMTLEVRVTNTAAQALYRQFGFAPSGIRARYYENTDDALVMWCHDLAGDEMARRLAEAERRGPS